MSTSRQRPRPRNDRTLAHKWAVGERPDKPDRLLLACSNCPESGRRGAGRRGGREALVLRHE